MFIGSGGTSTDYRIFWDGETNDGEFFWMEDEDYFRFADDIQLPDNELIKLGTDADATIGYNGTDLVINPRAVGSGSLMIGTGAAGVDYQIKFNGESNDGYII